MWQLKIEDPSGQIRTLSLKNKQQAHLALGRLESADIVLRDPTTAPEAAQLWTSPSTETAAQSPFWLKIPSSQPASRVGDLWAREVQLVPGVSFTLGETRLTLERTRETPALPPQPVGIRHWLTATPSGAQTLSLARKAATTPLSVYLAGETGTGKEVLAHLLHAWSPRASGPFVPLHCGALSLSLVESELFGHVKGAFTGALHQRPGALMQAHGGTLFLDEVGDLPLDIQVKLLRFLENGEIRPVGADRPSRADVRILCATHHPLRKLVEEGKFRRDLYFRIASVTIEIPTLRDRPADIEMLANQFAQDLGRTLTPRARLRLQAHPWPGNVRELRHAVERASGVAGDFQTVLTEESFDFLLTVESPLTSPTSEAAVPVLTLKEMERLLILKALRITDGNRAKAARCLGIARSTLFEMLKRHRIKGPRAAQIYS